MNHVVELIRAGNTEEARKVQLDKIVPSADRLERLTNQLVNIAEADMVAAIETTQGAYGTSRLIVASSQSAASYWRLASVTSFPGH